MAKFGGGVDELKLDALQSPTTVVDQEGLQEQRPEKRVLRGPSLPTNSTDPHSPLSPRLAGVPGPWQPPTPG